MAVRPLRCLGLAVKDGADLGPLAKLTSEEEAAASPYLRNPSQFAQIESNLVFLGIAGIKDPARPEAARAILQCREAGVRVIMITGDSRETAIAIGEWVRGWGNEEGGLCWRGRHRPTDNDRPTHRPPLYTHTPHPYPSTIAQPQPAT